MNIIPPNEQTRVSLGDTVRLHFSVALENGDIIDSTFDGEPPSLVIGDGTLPDGFERVLINLTTGDTRTAHLTPDEGFGAWHSHNVQHFFADRKSVV